MPKTLFIFSSLYRPHVGGVETFTRNLALELVRQGVRVVVVTCQLDPSHPAEEDDEGICVLRLPCKPLMNARFPMPLHNAQARALWGRLAEEPLDFAIINTRFYPLSIAAARFCESRGVRPVVIDHGSAHLTVGNAPLDVGVQAIEHALTRKMRTYPADYYGISSASVAWLRHFGIKACGTITNAIDADAFTRGRSGRALREEWGIPRDSFLVCSVGRLAPEKGCRQLVEAARLLAASTPAHPASDEPADRDSDTPAIAFALAGDGPLADELRRDAPASVRLAGPLATPDVAELLCEADLLCMPTRSEGFSTALLEAAACTTPALITRVGGVEELIPTNDFGTVLEDDRPETIARRIRELAADPARCKSQGSAAHDRVKELFSWKTTAACALSACERANS